MELNLKIINRGDAKGTVGWIAKMSDRVEIAPTKSGEPAAWLMGKDGKTITILAIGGETGSYDPSGVALVTRRGEGDWAGQCHIYTTDAGWSAIAQIADMARTAMLSEEEAEAEVKVTVTLEGATK